MSLVMDRTGVSVEVRGLIEAFEVAARVVPVDQPAAVALEDTRALLALREQLDVHLLHRLSDVEARQLHDLDAMPTVSTWVEQQATSVDRGMVALARRVGRLSTVQGELDAGRLSLVAARKVATSVERVRGFLDRPDGLIDGQPAEAVLAGVILRGVPQLFGEVLGGVADSDPRLVALVLEVAEIFESGRSEAERVEAAFVALARRLEPSSVRSALDLLVDALLPQQLEDRTAAAHRDRGLALHPNSDGVGGRLEADLDAEAYELVHTALAAKMATDPENVIDTAAAAELRRQGIDPYGLGRRPDEATPRNLLKRRHDALAALLADWLGSGIAGVRGKAVPHIAVRVGLDTLHDVPGALPAVGGSGQVLAAAVVRRWACDSALTRFVMTLGNKVIEMSHTIRTLKRHERKAKTMETGGRCQAAGCHHPPGIPLIPHHPDAYARSGTTSFYDTVMLCERSHHDLHEGGRTLRLKDGRLLAPDGWVTEHGYGPTAA